MITATNAWANNSSLMLPSSIALTSSSSWSWRSKFAVFDPDVAQRGPVSLRVCISEVSRLDRAVDAVNRECSPTRAAGNHRIKV
ncbi:MAG: hypothetical protein R3E50_13760 [Halioglobus sp.]